MFKSLAHKSYWFFKHLTQDPKWAFRRLVGYFKTPLFIFQMGKVGSMTIKKTLEANYFMCHIHTKSDFETYKARYAVRGQRVDMITATRDPLGREISAFFQNVTNLSHGYGVGTKNEVLAMGVDNLIREFFSRWNDQLPDTTIWFDRHFKTATGIDVYDYPFNPAQGWSIIGTDKWRVLILRFEDINRNYLEAVNTFVTARFGLESAYPAFLPSNLSESKWYGSLMKEFIDKIRFTPEQIEQQYGSKYCMHFYSDDEITKMKSRWKVI
jgi:hypothetical protein